MSRISISRCESYHAGDVSAAVTGALAALGGLGAFIQPGQTVLLKPNLLSAKPPAAAVTTHPAVVEAVAREVISAGARPLIGDSPPYQGHSAHRYENLCRATGMRDVADRLELEIVSMDIPCREIDTGGRLFKRAPVASAFLDADAVINLPKLKTHGLTGFSGAVKNMFGCIPGLRKSQLHLQAAEDTAVFQQMIVDVYAACRPTLNLMDAVVGMEGSGPSHGTPRQVGAILAGVDAVALDAMACRIVGIAPDSIATLRLASEQELGSIEGIEHLGVDPEGLKISDFCLSPIGTGLSQIPKPLLGPLKSQFVPLPRVSRDRCVACGDCVKVCAAGAMSLLAVRGSKKGRAARADFRKCIACYCCDEACAYDAIDIRKGWFGQIVSKK